MILQDEADDMTLSSEILPVHYAVTTRNNFSQQTGEMF